MLRRDAELERYVQKEEACATEVMTHVQSANAFSIDALFWKRPMSASPAKAQLPPHVPNLAERGGPPAPCSPCRLRVDCVRVEEAE